MSLIVSLFRTTHELVLACLNLILVCSYVCLCGYYSLSSRLTVKSKFIRSVMVYINDSIAIPILENKPIARPDKRKADQSDDKAEEKEQN